MARTAHDLTTVEISQRDSSTYGVLGSDGETIYTVALSAEGNTCTCPAGSNGRHCYHVAAVCARYVDAPVAQAPVPALTCTPLCGDCAVCGTHESILHNCGGRYVCTDCWLSGAYAA